MLIVVILLIGSIRGTPWNPYPDQVYLQPGTDPKQPGYLEVRVKRTGKIGVIKTEDYKSELFEITEPVPVGYIRVRAKQTGKIYNVLAEKYNALDKTMQNKFERLDP